MPVPYSNPNTPNNKIEGRSARLYHSLGDKKTPSNENIFFQYENKRRKRSKKLSWKSQSTPPIVATYKDVTYMTNLAYLQKMGHLDENIEMSPPSSFQASTLGCDDIRTQTFSSDTLNFIEKSIKICRHEFIRAI